MSVALISARLFEILNDLPVSRQAEVLDFALFLRERERMAAWNEIGDEDAAKLSEEFAEEDLALAEAGMADYLSQLQHEDNA